MERLKYFNEYLQQEEDFEKKILEALYLALPAEDKIELTIEDLYKYQINESFITSIKTTGKKVLDKIISISKNITEFLSRIREELSKHLSNFFNSSKAFLKERILKDKKIGEIIKDKIKLDRIAFIQDLKTCKNVFNFYTHDFFSDLIKKIMSSFHNHFLSKNITEALVNENLNVEVVDNAVTTITNKPPFVWLTGIHEAGTMGVEKLIAFLSNVTTKLGGPAFVLPVIASLIGLYLEHGAEGLITSGIIKTIEFFTIPFVALIIEFISHIALVLTIYELCVEIMASIDRLEQRHEKHHKHHNNGGQAGPQKVEKNI